jgi:Sec-independent protein translocase protein TatA
MFKSGFSEYLIILSIIVVVGFVILAVTGDLPGFIW